MIMYKCAYIQQIAFIKGFSQTLISINLRPSKNEQHTRVIALGRGYRYYIEEVVLSNSHWFISYRITNIVFINCFLVT